MKSLWSLRVLRPWLFRRWEREQRRALESAIAVGRAGTPLSPGAAAPAFELPDDLGRRRRSGEWLGRGAAVVWFTNLCEVCADQARELARAREQGALEISVLAIHFPGPSAPAPAEFRRDTGWEFPILIDDGTVARAWAGEAVPDT